MKIFLIGFMGSGKSLVGKRLAASLGCPFFDLDTLIVEGEEMSIPAIFETNGEQAFREAEAKHLRNTEFLPPSIIATGGGTPCFLENMKWMQEHGLVIYLKVSEKTLLHRLKAEIDGRPLLKGKSEDELLNFISQLLNERESVYSKANFICKADLEADHLVRELVQYFKKFPLAGK